MSRPRTIVAFGELFLAEYPDRSEPAGITAAIPAEAVRQEHVGIAVSRVGQDRFADEVTSSLRAAGVDITHVQSDPDLATARLVTRGGAAAAPTTRQVYDNIQWDFDLSDLAQETDAVVFGVLAVRDGQTRSTLERFTAECPAALHVADLSCRWGATMDRDDVSSLLGIAHIGVLDHEALHVAQPAAPGMQSRDAITSLLRRHDLAAVLLVERDDESLTISAHASEGAWVMPTPCPRAAYTSLLLGYIAATLSGCDAMTSLQESARRVLDTDLTVREIEPREGDTASP